MPSRGVGEATAPPSKSMAHRALICSALSSKSTVTNLSFSNDIAATLNCLKALGAKTEISGSDVTIGGLNIRSIPENAVLDCNESGSTLRFLIPLCLLSGKRVTLTGAKRLFERPLSIYESICTEQGILFDRNEDSLTVCGVLKSGSYKIPGDVSSQFITGLLYALPLLDGISILEVTGTFESASYVDLTLSALADFGIRITRSDNRFIIYGNQTYKSNNYIVEGDCSNAAFLSALDYLGGDVKVSGISPSTKQGDRVYIDMFQAIDNGVRCFDLSDCPDLAPIMFAVSAAKGGAEFVGTKRLKIKESDRAGAMAQELKKFGIPVTIGENSVAVGNAPLKAPEKILNGHNDHRIVMSLAVLSTLVGGIIDGAEAVAKSYPDFFDVLKSLKIGIEIYDA